MECRQLGCSSGKFRGGKEVAPRLKFLKTVKGPPRCTERALSFPSLETFSDLTRSSGARAWVPHGLYAPASASPPPKLQRGGSARRWQASLQAPNFLPTARTMTCGQLPERVPFDFAPETSSRARTRGISLCARTGSTQRRFPCWHSPGGPCAEPPLLCGSRKQAQTRGDPPPARPLRAISTRPSDCSWLSQGWRNRRVTGRVRGSASRATPRRGQWGDPRRDPPGPESDLFR